MHRRRARHRGRSVVVAMVTPGRGRGRGPGLGPNHTPHITARPLTHLAREAFGEVPLLAKHRKEHSRLLSKRTANPILRILLADLVFSVFGTVEIPKKRVRGSKGWSKTLLRLRTREEPVPMQSRKLKRRSVKISKMPTRVCFQWEKQQE